MRLSTLIIDDFHPCAATTRRAALGLDYGPVEYKGHTYTGISQEFDPEGVDGLLERVMGRPVTRVESYFRVGTKDEQPTTHIHADSVLAEYACVWHLSEPPSGLIGGTALWRHKQFGLEQNPTVEGLADLPLETGAYEALINADGNDESKWDMIGLLPQKFNRLVIYPSHVFHSRFPRDAWGTTPKDGRLIWVSFFT